MKNSLMLMYVLYTKPKPTFDCNIAPVLPQALQESPPERKRDMKKDLLLFAAMCIGIFGAFMLILFDPVVPVWIEIGIPVLIGAMMLKDGYHVWRKEN